MALPCDPSPDGGRTRQASETEDIWDDQVPVKYHPVDRGWSWIIMIGVFVIHFLTTGYLRSFGLLFVEFQSYFQASSTLTATMSGVQMLAYSLGTFVTMNFLIKFISVKTSCLMGCCLELLSITGNAMVTDIRQLIFTHGILFGFGQALIYCPAMVILSEYFDRKRPIATVFASGGVSAGGAVLPFLIQYLIDTYGLIGGVLLTAGVIFQQAVFVSFFTSPSEYIPASEMADTVSNEGEFVPNIASKEYQSGRNGGESTIAGDKHTVETQSHRGKQDHQNSPGDKRLRKEQNHLDHPGSGNKPQKFHQRQNSAPESQTPIIKISLQNSINGEAEVAALPKLNGSHPQLSSPADNNSLHETGNVSHIPHQPNGGEIEPTGDSNQSRNQNRANQEQSLYSKLDISCATKTTNESDAYHLIAPEDAKSHRSSKQSLLSVNAKETHHLSKSSINSSHSCALSDNCSRVEHGETDHSKKKLPVPRTSLHTLGFPSDTLVRALSTSSVDVLGSAHPISHHGSSMSVRNRRRGYSVDRPPDSDYSRRYLPSDRYSPVPRRTRLRLAKCKFPEMVKKPAFWLLAVFFFGGGMASVLSTVFLPPLAQSRGLDTSSSSRFLVVSAIMEMLGRLVPGLVLHFGFMRPSTVVLPSMILCGILLQLVTFFNDFKSLIGLSCLIGYFTGAFWAMQILVVIEIIGMESLGRAFGFYSIMLGFGVGGGFPLAGAMADATGTYNIPYNFFGAMYLLASFSMVLVQFTRRPEDPESSEHDDDDGDDDHECSDDESDDRGNIGSIHAA